MGKIYSANVGDRFIIEIGAIADVQGLGADNDNIDTFYKVKGFNSLVFDDNGIEKLVKAKDLKDEVEEAYNKGYAKAMQETQKAVRTFLAMNCENREKYFDGEYAITAIFGTYDFREIIEKLEAYEKEQSEIRVGDEVEVIDFGCEAVVTCTNKHLKSVFVLYYDGSTYEFADRTKLRKTGRHFDEVEKLIEILKGGDDSEQISF